MIVEIHLLNSLFRTNEKRKVANHNNIFLKIHYYGMFLKLYLYWADDSQTFHYA